MIIDAAGTYNGLIFLIFKEDIKSCFNHLRWKTRSSKFFATMMDLNVVFVMLTGGFGHTFTPMQWDVVVGGGRCNLLPRRRGLLAFINPHRSAIRCWSVVQPC
jgi:hypothetical protein